MRTSASFRRSKRFFGGSYAKGSYRVKAKTKLTPVTIQQMHILQKSGNDTTLIKTGEFLRKEIPVRLAKQTVALENLPYGLSNSQEVATVNDLNKDAYNRITMMGEVKSKEDAQRLGEVFHDILNTHYLVVPLLNMAIHQSPYDRKTLIACPFLTSFIGSYFTRRIGIRLVMSQYVKVLQGLSESKTGNGEIHEDCNVGHIVKEALNEVVAQCGNIYGFSPPVQLVNKQSVKFKYPGRHIKLIVVELLRNSLRATCESRSRENIQEFPIKVVICNGNSDLSIKVSDMGGGISRDQLDTVWNYGSTSGPAARRRIPNEVSGKIFNDQLKHIDTLAAIHQDSLAKLGYGLPVARCYARFFGGELELYSIEGHGLDAFVHLKLAAHVMEPFDAKENAV